MSIIIGGGGDLSGKHNQSKDYYELKLGNYDLFFKKSYEILYNINDFLIAIFFLIGSILFLSDKWEYAGVWCFIIGSAQYAVRPLIRIIHSIHFKKYVKKQSQEGKS